MKLIETESLNETDIYLIIRKSTKTPLLNTIRFSRQETIESFLKIKKDTSFKNYSDNFMIKKAKIICKS